MLDANYEAFEARLQELMATNPGRFAVMHKGEVAFIMDTLRDANTAAMRLYGDGEFSIQEITRAPIDLGWYSHAHPARTA